MNLPNKLSLARVIMVPVFMIVIALPESVMPDVWSRIIGTAIFILTALTDMLDGMIARKCNMITDFGKFIDPLADKFMIFGAMLVILYKYEYIRPVFLWVALIARGRRRGVARQGQDRHTNALRHNDTS